MKKYLLAFTCFALFATSCYKDEDNTPPSEVIIEISEVLINTTVTGSVLDIDGDAMRTYSLAVNDTYADVDAPLFLLKLNEVSKKGQSFHVLKEGKQIGISTQLLVENDINHFEIRTHDFLSQKMISDADPIVEINGSLSFDFSNVAWTNGYQENVSVDFVFIDAETQLTPVGYSELSDLLAIDSKGGFYLQPRAANEDKLNATEESPIILQLKDLPEGVNGLFAFDAEKEIWVLVDNVKEGDEVEIAGVGYYTFASYSKGVFVEGRVTNEGKPVAYQPMQWNLLNLSNTLCATEMGRWIGLFPENEDVSLELLNPCKEALQEETLSIPIDDLKDQNLEIENGANYQLLDMSIFDCEGNIVDTPNLNIESEENEFNYIFSEDYNNRWIAVCDEYSVAAANSTTGETGPRVDWNTEIEGNYDVMTECEELANGYSYIKIEDKMKIFEAFNLEEAGERTILRSQEENVEFVFQGNSPGMYAEDKVNVFIDDADLGYYIKCENSPIGCGITEFNVTHFQVNEGEGSIVRVTFAGTLWMQTISPPVAGNYDVEGVILIKR